MSEARRHIALFGSYQPAPGEPEFVLAERIGSLLGAAGFDLINGGHDGTMAASAKGAKAAGARTIGVTCRPIRDARSIAVNEHLSEVIEAPDLLSRIEIMMRRAAGYVVMAGGTGTLAELGIVWEHVHKRLITPRPIVVVGDAWKPLIEMIGSRYASALQIISAVETAEQAVDLLKARAADVPESDREFLPACATLRQL